MYNSVVLSPPQEVAIVTGKGYAFSPLNAFDNALVKASIGNISLIKVTSILPANVKFIPLPEFPAGASIPTIYTSYVSRLPDKIVSAAIGYAYTVHGPTLVAEASGPIRLRDQKNRVVQHINDMSKARGLSLIGRPCIRGVESEVEDITCVFAAIVYVR
ncbi:MAG: pyruvoyl-dependent arginine decarboxylase [Candidatus Ranarchaeia archaeon]